MEGNITKKKGLCKLGTKHGSTSCNALDEPMALPYVMDAPKIRFSLLQMKEGGFKKWEIPPKRQQKGRPLDNGHS